MNGHIRLRDRYAVALLMALALLFSAAGFMHQSLRLDEAQSLWQTSESPSGILDVVAHDVHVPLYHELLHGWRIVFGNGVPEARALSLLFFVLTIPAAYLLGREAYGPGVGLLTAGLVALSPFLNWYGNEIRMYSMLAFVSVVSHWLFLRIQRGARNFAWGAYAATAVVGMYTHYFFAFVLMVQAGYLVAEYRKFPRGTFLRFVLVMLLVGVALSPWIAYVAHLGLAQETQPLLVAPTTVNLFNSFSQFLFGFQDDHLNTLLVSLWPLVALLGFLALRRDARLDARTLYVLAAAVLPLVITFAISLALRPVYVTRYLIIAVPPLYLFIAWMVSVFPRRLARGFALLTLGLMFATLLVQAASARTPAKENYREAAEYLEADARASDAIAVTAPFTVYPVEYYYAGPGQIRTIPAWDRFQGGGIPGYDEGQVARQVADLAGTYQRLFVLFSYDQGYAEKLRIFLDTHYERVEEKQFSPGLVLYAYRLRYDSLATP